VTWQVRALAQQILGRESGTIHKDWGGRLPVALVFPNSYYVGMSSLALQSLYRWFNSRDDIVCERIFLPPTKGGSRQAGLQFAPLALESQRPLDDFAVLAIHLSFEMDAFHLLQMLRAAGIPLRSADRDEVWPLLVAGGPAVSANPEPLAPFLDAVFVGEIEERIDALLDALHLAPDGHPAALAALARVPGIYIPAYHTEGSRVQRQWTADLDAWPAHTVAFTPDTEFGDMGLLEIARGCERGCRFCLAGTVYRPRRERSVDNLLAQARWLLTHRERLGLVSAAVSDHSQIDTLAPRMRQLGARISVSSLRTDPLSQPLLVALSESGTQTLTLAPEAGSRRLREAIHKTQTEEDVLRAVEMAARLDFSQLKLYFLLGLPGETQGDVEALVGLSRACAARFPRQVTVQLTPFVPKAHTAFQREAQTPAAEVKRRVDYAKKALWRQGIAVRAESPAWAEIQGCLARGDRRLAAALEGTDRLTPAAWRKAVQRADLSMEELLGARPLGTPLPWRFIRHAWHAASPPACEAGSQR
jgi:radical SAM superfamily enzyme YgiQ (UPF0313 family)